MNDSMMGRERKRGVWVVDGGGLVIASFLDVVKLKQLVFHSKEMTGANCVEKQFGGFLLKYSFNRSMKAVFGSLSSSLS